MHSLTTQGLSFSTPWNRFNPPSHSGMQRYASYCGKAPPNDTGAGVHSAVICF